jgi:hypothetical protein
MRLRLTWVFTVVVMLAWPVVPRAATVSKKITWANEQWIPVNLSSEGVSIKDIRFEVEGGIHWNPLRAGKGPQCFVQIKNESDHPMHLAVAVVLYDDHGDLVGATESGHIGELNPNESGEIKMTFREVKRRFFEAKTGQIALETFK